MSSQQVINYDTPGNFTYDTDLIEFSGSIARLKSQIEANETIYQNFATKDLLRFAGGSNVGTLAGVATIDSGALKFPNGIGQWSFNPQGMIGSDPNVGCIRFKHIPQYSGTPAETQVLVVEQKASADNSNQIFIQHAPVTGNVIITFRDQNGTVMGSLVAITGWSPIAGTEYEFELNFDVNAGTPAQRFFIDGIQQGATSAFVGVRNLSEILITQISGNTPVSNFWIKDYQRFDSVQHTSNFASEVPRTVSATTYPTTSPTILHNSSVGMTELIGFAETTATKPANTEIKYTLVYAMSDWYLSGGVLTPSDGTYAQASSAAELSAALASGALDVVPDTTVALKAFLNSSDGEARPEIGVVTLDYNLFVSEEAKTKCQVYGYVKDNCVGVSGAKVKITSDPGDAFPTTGSFISINEEVETSSTGYFIVTLQETATAQYQLDVLITWTDAKGQSQLDEFKIIVPAEASKKLEDCIV